jgi:arylsulfatase A-like enzyme
LLRGFIALIAAGWSLIPSGARTAVATPVRPNIVFILTDDMRYDSLRYMPNVRNLLGARGMTFTNMDVVNPWCCPSRVAYLKGLYSHSSHVYTVVPPYGGFEEFNASGGEQSTIATWLHDAGYRTGLFGKYLNGYGEASNSRVAAQPYVPPGWDRWFAFGKVDANSDDGYYYNYEVADDDAFVHFGHNATDYGTDVVWRKTTRFIRGSQQPFFAYVAPFAPHIPAIPAPQDVDRLEGIAPARPPSWNEKDVSDKPEWIRSHLGPFDATKTQRIDDTRRHQLESLIDVDRMVGGIVGTLKDKGVLQNTMIVFSSDNGYLWGEHRWGEKRVPYEESIHVPLVIRYDPLTTGAGTSNRLVANIDLAPTWAELAGINPPDAVDGTSLMPLLRAPVSTWRNSILIEHMQASAQHDPVTTYCAIRTVGTADDPHRYMYAVYGTGEQELYVLDNDPFQLRNSASAQWATALVASLRARLKELCAPEPPLYHALED